MSFNTKRHELKVGEDGETVLLTCKGNLSHAQGQPRPDVFMFIENPYELDAGKHMQM